MTIFLTGSTGYMGQRLIPLLLDRGHRVRALVRAGSEKKLPAGCEPVVGDALDAASYAGKVSPADTFVHLVGVPRPNPWKGAQFRAVDLPSIRAAVTAATRARVQHFVYLSVAHPAPIMQDYIEVRSEGERLLRESGLIATFLRPWYVLGPGHYWPYLLLPAYRFFELLPATRASAQRLGLVTLPEMLAALVAAVEDPPAGVRIVEVPQIRSTVRK
ncbi:MAG: SDR family oxidoreductase [Terriglobales bacterium]